MRYLFFDLETNSPYQRQARLVQLAFIITDEQSNIHNTYENIAIPNDFDIQNAHIHGITLEMAQAKGIPSLTIIEQFMEQVQQVDLLVAHHAEYHKKVIFNELKSLKLTKQYFSLLYNKDTYCTMQSSIEFCQIKKRGKEVLKYPKLTELYTKLFEVDRTDEKSAISDAKTVMQCYFALQRVLKSQL